jgi:phosphate transport system permease protein
MMAVAPERSLHSSSPRLRRRLVLDRALRWVFPLALLVVLLPLFDMIYWISIRALPTFTWATLTTDQVGLGGGLYAMILGSFTLLGLATGIAALVGISAGMFTAEYAPPSIQRPARLAGNLLAGVPAIVVGYFGYYALVLYTHWGYTSLAGGITLGVFMVPYIYRTADLAFANVPSQQREAALAIGARRSQYLLRVALPIALPAILSGVFLSMAIGLGETAPLLYTAGWSSTPVVGLFQPTSFLTGAIWNFYDFPSTEGSFQTLAFQAAWLLLLMVIGLNILVQIVAERYRRRTRGMMA